MFLATVASASETSSQAPKNFNVMDLFPMVAVFLVVYFFMIRPQANKQKEHQAMLSNIRKGMKLVTTGGIIGQVIKVEDDNVLIFEISPNVRIKIMRSAVASVLNEGGAPDSEEISN
jgi:preprotein translocase subunit YajC